MVEKLTDEQEKMLIPHRMKWIEKFYADHGKYAEHDVYKKLVRKAFDLMEIGYTFPERLVVSSSPSQSLEIFKQLAEENGKEFDIMEYLNNHDNFDYTEQYAILAEYSAYKDVLGLDIKSVNDYIDVFGNLFLYCCKLWAYDKVIVFEEKPVYVKRDEKNNIHCEDGPAIGWKTGEVLYFYHGKKMNSKEELLKQPIMTFVPQPEVGFKE